MESNEEKMAPADTSSRKINNCTDADRDAHIPLCKFIPMIIVFYSTAKDTQNSRNIIGRMENMRDLGDGVNSPPR